MPVQKLSIPTTWWPSARRRSTSVDPMNPAAPVTKARMARARAGGAEYKSSPPPAIQPSPNRERRELPIDETHRSPPRGRTQMRRVFGVAKSNELAIASVPGRHLCPRSPEGTIAGRHQQGTLSKISSIIDREMDQVS